MYARTLPIKRGQLHRWEFEHASHALRVAQSLGCTGCRCKVGRDPGKPWHVEIC